MIEFDLEFVNIADGDLPSYMCSDFAPSNLQAYRCSQASQCLISFVAN